MFGENQSNNERQTQRREKAIPHNSDKAICDASVSVSTELVCLGQGRGVLDSPRPDSFGIADCRLQIGDFPAAAGDEYPQNEKGLPARIGGEGPVASVFTGCVARSRASGSNAQSVPNSESRPKAEGQQSYDRSPSGSSADFLKRTDNIGPQAAHEDVRPPNRKSKIFNQQLRGGFLFVVSSFLARGTRLALAGGGA